MPVGLAASLVVGCIPRSAAVASVPVVAVALAAAADSTAVVVAVGSTVAAVADTVNRYLIQDSEDGWRKRQPSSFCSELDFRNPPCHELGCPISRVFCEMWEICES